MRKLTIAISVLVLVIAFAYLLFKEGSMPVRKDSTNTKIFVIQPGQSLSTIVNNLEKENLIRNKVVFYLIVKQLGIDKKIQAGDFRLSEAMDAYTIAQKLTKGTLDIWVTIIEGLRKEEIAQIIAQKFAIPEAEFLRLAEEGKLFPDTYLFPKQATAGAIISIMMDNFNRKVNQDLMAQARLRGLTVDETLILASLVEKEAKHDVDRKKIASIILKRWRNNWPLQIDATIQYALGYQPNDKTWWKPYLTKEDLEIDSLYNTYKNPGLPPTPICNPGLASIKAVIGADPQTPYWYYLSDLDGNIHYAVTLEQHHNNIRRYLNR